MPCKPGLKILAYQTSKTQTPLLPRRRCASALCGRLESVVCTSSLHMHRNSAQTNNPPRGVSSAAVAALLAWDARGGARGGTRDGDRVSGVLPLGGATQRGRAPGAAARLCTSSAPRLHAAAPRGRHGRSRLAPALLRRAPRRRDAAPELLARDARHRARGRPGLQRAKNSGGTRSDFK